MLKRFFVAFVLVAFSSHAAFALTAREIMDKTGNLPKPKTARTSVIMTIENEGIRQVKEFKMLSKEAPGVDKSLFAFVRPTKLKVLTHSVKGKDADQWVSLSSGKVKRIVGSEQGGSFANSHLSYDDIQIRSIDDYNYTLLPDGTAAGAKCYKVEAVKKVGTRIYDKSVIYVRQADFYILRIDFYKDGQMIKYLENSDIRTVEGILTAYIITMTLSSGTGKTVLSVKSLEYNKGIPDSEFSKENLN